MPKIRPYNKQEDSLKKLLGHALVEKGWTKQHLGELCGMDSAMISKIFHSPEKHNITTILDVCRKLGIKEIPVV